MIDNTNKTTREELEDKNQSVPSEIFDIEQSQEMVELYNEMFGY